MLVHDPFLQGNDGVVRDGNILRADPGATFGDITIADAESLFEFGDAIFGVERMHFQCGDVGEKTRSDELLVFAVVAQHMTDILTEITLNALPKFLHAINVGLGHSPGSVRGIGRAGFEGFDGL
jgi:hypothetical protein